MRIIVITKRQYTNLDLLDNRFGRLREIPLSLARTGHNVEGICLSYRSRREGRYIDGSGNAAVQWQSVNAQRLFSLGHSSYWYKIDHLMKCFKPDLIWACSDAFHTIIGSCLAKKYGVKLVVDLYDNFESFSMTYVPGVTSVFRKALRSAIGVTCVSKPLKQYIRQIMQYKGPVEVIQNAVPEGRFYPINQSLCRKKLGLPKEGVFIGTAGHLSKSRGIKTLFRAFEILSGMRSNVHLVLAGSCDRDLSFPKNTRLHYLGSIQPEMVPFFISSLDINVICNRDSDFGRYCFPQKFYEAVACRVPIVAAEVGVMKELLKESPSSLYQPDEVEDLVKSLDFQLNKPKILSLDVPTWDGISIKTSNFFNALLN
jgi:teichuronic acid biosynthesis glycosyltransferase TuaC